MSIMEELHILLNPNKEHKKVFPNLSVKDFRNNQSLKDHLHCVKSVYIWSFSSPIFEQCEIHVQLEKRKNPLIT